MSNQGKYFDRFPNIRTAGIRMQLSGVGVSECLRTPLTCNDAAEAIVKRLPDPTGNKYQCAPLSGVNYMGSTRVRERLSSEVSQGFEGFRAELRETAYKSYWTREVGRLPDQVPNLPIGMDIETNVFGKKQISNGTAREVINPDKCRSLVIAESKIGHENYLKSHNSYEAGEQKVRMDPPLPPGLIFGKKSPSIDYSGKNVKKLLQWIEQSQVTMTSQSLAEYKDKHYYPLGKGRVRSGVPIYVTKDTVFGKPTHHNEPVVMKSPDELFALQVGHLSMVKRQVHQKEIELISLLRAFRTMDPDNNKTVPKEHVYEVTKSLGLIIDPFLMNSMLERLQILDSNGNVEYQAFLHLIDIREDMPDFGRGSKPAQEYSTAYREQCKDLEKKPEADALPLAGAPSMSFDYPGIQVPEAPGWCLAHLEDIPKQTTVDDVVRPHIFTHFGLSYFDMFKPREKEFIRDLGVKIGLEIPDNVFELMWKEGIRRDGCVSVETFRNILDEVSTGKLEVITNR